MILSVGRKTRSLCVVSAYALLEVGCGTNMAWDRFVLRWTLVDSSKTLHHLEVFDIRRWCIWEGE
jgi:hypothetical protein